MEVTKNEAGGAAFDTPNVCGLGLPTVEEGKLLETNSSEKSFEIENRAFGLISDVTEHKKKDDSSSEGQLFLIDLEEVNTENGKKLLKPTSKKFSASSLFSSKMAQNWFFRNKDSEDTDNLVDDEDRLKSPERDTSEKSVEVSRKDSRGENGAILSKIKNIVDKNKSKHREMNFWQPQGS